MPHVVLLGDSVFDNQIYVTPGPAVIEQLRQELGTGAEATLVAVDGHITRDVARSQLVRVPSGATHLIASAGGNDALAAAGVLNEPANSVAEATARLGQIRRSFEATYIEMVEAVPSLRLPTALCTIYDTNYPEPYRGLVITALALFNDVILRTAFRRRLPVIDLRLVCCDASDFANPIEPSVAGGHKLARVIAALVANGGDRNGSTVWS
jgi:hypothetical protein